MRQTAAACGALLLIALAVYGHLLAPGRVPYSPHSDVMTYALGAKTASGAFWRRDILSGTAGFLDPPAANLSPLSAPFLLAEPAKAMGWAFFLFYLTAGLSGFALARALKLPPVPSLIAGAAQMCSFKLIAAGYAGWPPSFHGAAVLPFLFAAVLRVLDAPGPRTAALAALAGALGVHAGHPQLLYYSALFLLALAAWKADRRAWTWLAAAAALAAALSASVLLPWALDLPLLSRSGSSSYRFFLSGHALDPRHLLAFVHPEALGSPFDGRAVELWEDAGSFGLAALALALVGAAARRRPESRLLLAGALASLLLAFAGPLQSALFHAAPGWSLFRLPGRLLFLTLWFGAALAGVGADELMRRAKGRANAVAALLLLLIAAEGALWARRYLKTAPADAVAPRLEAAAAFVSSAPRPWRAAPLERSLLNYGWAAHLGLELVTGYASYNYRHYQEYMDVLRWGEPRDPGGRVWTDLPALRRPDLLDALNTRWLLARGPLDAPGSRYPLAARFALQPQFVFYKGMNRAELAVHENKSAKPRAWLPDAVVPARDANESLGLLQRIDLRRAAIAEGGAADIRAAAKDSVEVTGYGPDRLELKARLASPRFVAISEVWHPGWSATLNGTALGLVRTNHALLGLWAPEGESFIALRFTPPGWDAGRAIAAAALLAIFGIFTGLAPSFSGRGRSRPRPGT